MTVRCAICVNFSLKASLKRGAGLYNCKLMKPYEFPNPFIERVCPAFKQVPDDEMKARTDWEARAQ